MEGIPQTQSTPDNLKPKWRERFAFFDQYGAPTSEPYKAAFRALPFGKKLLINNNFIAFSSARSTGSCWGCGRRTWSCWPS